MSNYKSKYEGLSIAEKLELIAEIKYSIEIDKKIENEMKLQKVRNQIIIGDMIQYTLNYKNKGEVRQLEGQIIAIFFDKLRVQDADGNKRYVGFDQVVL